VDRALILAEDGRITPADLPPQIARLMPAPESAEKGGNTLRDQVRRFECSLIVKAITDAGGDRRLAARNLGIGLSSLYRKIEEFETLGLMG
jgi:two-component system response regulator AtoC